MNNQMNICLNKELLVKVYNDGTLNVVNVLYTDRPSPSKRYESSKIYLYL